MHAHDDRPACAKRYINNAIFDVYSVLLCIAIHQFDVSPPLCSDTHFSYYPISGGGTFCGLFDIYDISRMHPTVGNISVLSQILLL